MGVMATRTSELPTGTPSLSWRRNRMVRNRMPRTHLQHVGMASGAEFVGRFDQHIGLVGCMRIMTGDATGSKDDAMNKGHPFILPFSDQIPFVAVTDDADIPGTFCPELPAMVFPMRIMAESAPSHDQGSVNRVARKPGPVRGMATKADLMDPQHREADPPGVDGLLMTAETLLVDGGAVLPGPLIDDLRMACAT